MKYINDNTILLCRQGSCCPTVEKIGVGEAFEIKDDFGGKVQLTLDQVSMLKEAVEKLSISEKFGLRI